MATAGDFSALQLIKNHLFDELAFPLVKPDPNQIFEFAAESDFAAEFEPHPFFQNKISEEKVFGSRSSSIRKLMLEAEAPPLHHWSSSRTKAGKQFRLVNKQREQIYGVDDQRQNTSDRNHIPSYRDELKSYAVTGSRSDLLDTNYNDKNGTRGGLIFGYIFVA